MLRTMDRVLRFPPERSVATTEARDGIPPFLVHSRQRGRLCREAVPVNSLTSASVALLPFINALRARDGGRAGDVRPFVTPS